MKTRRALALALSALASCLWSLPSSAEPPSYLTYDNTPLGTLEKPLILRTYMPDPDLDDEVFANHGRGANSPKYSPNSGKDQKGEYKPVKGIPAAIGVSHGPALSYCFDTTECRLMYAWQGGFLDMYPYWGDPERGNRQSYNYVPHLMGNLFYKASGVHPLQIDGKSISESGSAPRFLGYTLRNNIPEFRYKVGAHTITATFTPAGENELYATFACDPSTKLDYRPGGRPVPRQDRVIPPVYILGGPVLATFQGFPRNMKITEANATNGEKLYLSYGCIACHTADGSKGHGPTFAGLFGKKRAIEGGDEVLADAAYLLESIKTPNAKTAKGFPPNYMPPYQLKDLEYESLVLFIQNLGQPE